MFFANNSEWAKRLKELRDELDPLFSNSYSHLVLTEKTDDKTTVRRHLTKLRFAINRLLVLNCIPEELPDLLHNKPWYIREPMYVMENLAIQGHIEVIREFLPSSHDPSAVEGSEQYMRTIALRALRYSNSHQLPAHIFEKIVEIATVVTGNSISLAERVMASESWLYLLMMNYGDNPIIKNDVSEENISSTLERHINQRLSVLTNALNAESIPKNNRLRSNYVLLIGIYKHGIYKQMPPVSKQTDDPLLHDAMRLMVMGINAFESYPEPTELRLEYYDRYMDIDDWKEQVYSL